MDQQQKIIESAIYETMSRIAKEKNKQVLKENVDEAIKKLEELSNLFNLNSQYPNKSKYYKDFGKYLYAIKHKEYYEKALTLITEILDIIRGEPLEIEIYKVNRSSNGKAESIEIYSGKESELEKIRKVRKNYKNEIQYLYDNLKKQEEVNNAFVKHFNNFEKMAKQHFQKKENKKRYPNFNEGHIIEAYKRHLIWKQHENFSDKITRKHVAIMLYFSINNIPWWQGGDIGYTQIKAINNARLASEKSVRMVANKLIQMYQNPDQFTYEEFTKMFTFNEREEMTDYIKLGRKSLNELLENKFSNLKKD